MELVHLDLGGRGRPPLVILHGLLGSSKNWRSAGRDLARHFHVFALDLRNHGQSPHAPTQTYDQMVGDLLEWLEGQGFPQATLLGHSLGGKVAMRFACREPERVARLYVIDIAPRPYPVDSGAFEALMRLDLGGVTSRNGADELLKADFPDRGLRQYVLTNLVRRESGELRWQVNLPVLAAHLPELRESSLEPGDRFEGETLFVVGGKSRFVLEEDEARIRNHFPAVRIRVLPECGHYPHAEDRAAFVEALLRFDAEPS